MKSITVKVLKVVILCAIACTLIMMPVPAASAYGIEQTAVNDAENTALSASAQETILLAENDEDISMPTPQVLQLSEGIAAEDNVIEDDAIGDEENRNEAAKLVNGKLVVLTPEELAEFNRQLYNTQSFEEYLDLMDTLEYYNGGVDLAKMPWYDETEKNIGYIVPDVVGMTAAQAFKTLKDARFSVGVVYKYNPDSDMPVGYCYAQEVPAGVRYKDIYFNIYIQTQEGLQSQQDKMPPFGNLLVVIPNVVGMSESDALATLRNSGMSNISIIYQEMRDGTPFGYCISQNYSAGRTVVCSTQITICIQSKDFYRIVPDVVGMSRDDARALLESLDFQVSWTFGDDPEKSLPIGYCIGQSIKAGTNTYKDRIKLVLQSYIPPAETPQETETPQQDPSPSSSVEPSPTPSAEPSPDQTEG